MYTTLTTNDNGQKAKKIHDPSTRKKSHRKLKSVKVVYDEKHLLQW